MKDSIDILFVVLALPDRSLRHDVTRGVRSGVYESARLAVTSRPPPGDPVLDS